MTVIEYVIHCLAALTDEERLEVLHRFCFGCGGPAPCNCQRDS